MSKEYDICHYWCFKDIGFKYEPYFCNDCPDLMQKATSFNNIAIVYVRGKAYIIHFWHMSKDDATNIMNGFILTDKRGVLQKLFIVYKNEWMQFSWECWFNLLSKKPRHDTRAEYYYKNDKERLRGQARDKYINLSEEQNKKREYGRNRYLNMSEEKNKH